MRLTRRIAYLTRRDARRNTEGALNLAAELTARLVVGVAFLADRAVCRWARVTDTEEPS